MDYIYSLVDIFIENIELSEVEKSVLRNDLLALYTTNIAAWIMENMTDEQIMQFNKMIDNTDDVDEFENVIQLAQSSGLLDNPELEKGLQDELKSITSSILEQFGNDLPELTHNKTFEFINSIMKNA